jgi:hypothetical protein
VRPFAVPDEDDATKVDSGAPGRGITIPRWGLLLGFLLALLIGGGVVALVVHDHGAKSASTPTSESTSTTTSAAGATTPEASDPVGTRLGGGPSDATTVTDTTSTTRPLSPVTGLAPVVSETGHHFGMVPVGTTSGDWPIVISNPNTVPLEISLEGGATDPPFDATVGTCGGNSVVLPAGGSCRITFTFTPTSIGSVAGNTGITVVVVSTNANKHYDITFAGIGK